MEESKLNLVLKLDATRRIDSGMGLLKLYVISALLTYGALITALLSLNEHLTSFTAETAIRSLVAHITFCLGSVGTYICIEEIYYFQRRLGREVVSYVWLTYQITLAAFEVAFVSSYVLSFLTECNAGDKARPGSAVFLGALLVTEGLYCIIFGKLCALFAGNYQSRLFWISGHALCVVLGIFAWFYVLMACTTLLISVDAFAAVRETPIFARVKQSSDWPMSFEVDLLLRSFITIVVGLFALTKTAFEAIPPLILRVCLGIMAALKVLICVLGTLIILLCLMVPSAVPTLQVLVLFFDGFDAVLLVLACRFCTSVAAKTQELSKQLVAAEVSPGLSLLVDEICVLPTNGTLPMDGTGAHDKLSAWDQATLDIVNHL